MAEANLHAFDLDDTLVPGSSTERGFWKLAEYGALRLPDETLSHLAARRIDRTLAPQQPDSNFGYDWEIVLAFVAAVKNGLAVKDLKRASKEVAEEDVENIYPVMLERVNEVKAAGDRFVIISASDSFLVHGFAKAVGAFASSGSRFYIGGDGHLHRTRPPSSGALEKATRFMSMCKTIGATPKSAFGNDVSDEPMLRVAQNPYAVNPSERLRTIAQEEKWDIIEL